MTKLQQTSPVPGFLTLITALPLLGGLHLLLLLVLLQNSSLPQISRFRESPSSSTCLPPSDDAAKLAYASDSGITVYGSKTTRFLYEVTNSIRDGRGTAGVWDTTSLPKGNYLLRILAADYSGNEAQQGRDLLIAIK